MVDRITADDFNNNKGISPIQVPEKLSNEPEVDSTLSTIEKSKSVKPEITPPMSSPILSAPSNQESVAFVVASLDTRGRPVADTVTSFILKGEEIKNSILESWMKNLREIEEYVRQLLNSPVYQQLQEIRVKGDPQLGKVSGVEGPTAANAAAQRDPLNILSTLDRLQVLEKVPPSAEVQASSSPQDASQVLILPLAAALLAGGGLALGSQIVNTTSPLGGVLELVEQFKSFFPTVSLRDLVPLINLMVVAPLYFNSWNEAVKNLREGEHPHYVQTAQSFAKDVIQIVQDPRFIQSTLISRMRGTDQLSIHDQHRLERMLKVILIGVALSLLYSVEVGNVNKGIFGGMTPEELRGLMLGTWKKEMEKDPSLHHQLALTLTDQARVQLDPSVLSDEDRLAAAGMLVDYITKPRELEPMLDPAKVFDETLASTLFNPNEKINMWRG